MPSRAEAGRQSPPRDSPSGTRAEAVAFVVCEAIGIKAENSADYIQLYSGDKEALAESLEHVQRASAEILAAITPTD